MVDTQAKGDTQTDAEKTICHLYFHNCTTGDPFGFRNAEENARLISAAPELLVALEKIIKLIEHDSNDHDETLPEIIAANEAINKARGA